MLKTTTHYLTHLWNLQPRVLNLSGLAINLSLKYWEQSRKYSMTQNRILLMWAVYLSFHSTG